MKRTSSMIACLLCFGAGAGATWVGQQQVTRREPQFENAEVKVWKSIIMPNQPLNLHRHDHGRALIALTDGVLKAVDSNRKVLHTYTWKSGKAYWLGIDPPKQLHADVNDTGKPIEVIVVELKRDR